MRLSNEQLLSIGGLKLSNWLEGLSGNRLDMYCRTLADFVEKYPDIEADLKKSMFIGDNATLAFVLSELSETLANIHADGLVQECESLRAGITDADPDKLEADLTAFLSTVGTLSVDIQMEQHRAVENIKPKTRKYLAVSDNAKSILAVDDIPITLNHLKTVLQEAGYRFSGVTSGAAALDYVSKFTPDLFILDIEMPQMNGFELTEKLREHGQTSPIVFLTGNTTRDYLLKAVKVGAVDFIVKPVNAVNVTSKIKKIFGATI
jgi:CheY-like chemotaxis protein